MGQPELVREVESQSASPCSYRGPEDDFFCLRFQVWYPSRDCALRTRFKTCAGCLDCEQGRFNLKRHSVEMEQLRFHFESE